VEIAVIKIAMVEDDTELAELLSDYLQSFNIIIENFEDPFLALSTISLKHQEYDLIILDLTLPGLDGLEVCKELISKYDIPIIISSARSDIADKVTALELGADDYLPKPYDPRELEVRIKAILRRHKKDTYIQNPSSNSETFHLDTQKQEITKNNQYIKFTATEYQIMSLFLERKGFVISRYDILENTDICDDSGSIAVLINRIRTKIEEDPKNPKHLITLRGMGYKFIQ
jgi:two-component system OmpR family response regulator